VGSRHPEKIAGLIYLDAGYLYAYDPSPSEPSLSQPQSTIATVQEAIRAGGRKYTRIDVPILAIYALPHERGIANPTKRAEATQRILLSRERWQKPSRRSCARRRLSGLLMPITTFFGRMKRMSSAK
jgi:pimeloyl-ACP methyl ester carboxylesterase